MNFEVLFNGDIEDVCDTFETDFIYLYWVCTKEDSNGGLVFPHIVVIRISDYALIDNYSMMWGGSFPYAPNLAERIKIHTSMKISKDGNSYMFFGGSTKNFLGYAFSNRMTFVSRFDFSGETGCHFQKELTEVNVYAMSGY